MGFVVFVVLIGVIMYVQSSKKTGSSSNPDDNEVKGNPGDWNNYNDRMDDR